MGKICLVNPPTGAGSGSAYFPMALVALGTVLKGEGRSFEIVDWDLEISRNPSLLKDWCHFKRYAADKLIGTGSNIFGISSICSNFPTTLLLAEEIKRRKPSTLIILGGPQPSSVPEETLRSCPWIDVVVIGEGESTIVDLLASGLQASKLEQIPGIAFRSDDRIVRTQRRELIDDLDTLPFPDFDLVPLQEYLTRDPHTALIEAGRGCPFLCSFCSTALMWERQYRVKSPARILEEMRSLHRKYGLTYFPLTHDNFTTSHRFVAEFSDFFKKNNQGKFTWSSSARSDTLNIERLHLLQEAGCAGLYFGVDSGSSKMQKAIQKHLNLNQFKDHLKEAASLKIASVTSFIVGYPDESEPDLNETVRLGLWAKMTGAMEVQFSVLSPLAGTQMHEKTRTTLVYDPQIMTQTSPQLFLSPELDLLITAHPDLFSSFYSVPTPIGYFQVGALAIFYDFLVNHMAQALDRLLGATGWTPTELFRYWMEWRERKHPEKVISEAFVSNTIADFLTICLQRSRIPSVDRSIPTADSPTLM